VKTVNDEDAPDYVSNNLVQQALEICKQRLVKLGHSINSPQNTKEFLQLNLMNLEAERFDVLFLNNQHQLIAHEPMFYGTVDGASVYPREVAKRALHHNACAVIFAHNHPSGLATPSMADKNITDKLKQALNLFDIRVLDHIIVAGKEVTLFSEAGLI